MKFSYLIVTLVSLFVYTGIVHAKGLDITECVPEDEDKAAIVPKIIFSADYVTPAIYEGLEVNSHTPFFIDVQGHEIIAMPVTNIPNTTPGSTKASIEKIRLFNNGGGVMSEVFLRVNGRVFKISVPPESDDWSSLAVSDRVTLANPTIRWKGEIMYVRPDGGEAPDRLYVNCTTTHTEGIDYKPLMNMPTIPAANFSRLFPKFLGTHR